MSSAAFVDNWVPITISAFLVFGGFALMSGQAIARVWHPWTQGIGYGLLLSVGARLAEYVLFVGRAQNFIGYLVENATFVLANTVYLVAATLIAHRITRAHMMIAQYPWLYDRAGLFSWRPKP